jgi:uncharacterized membrane protein YphA (DoxX/SURF4 family)
VPVSGPDFVPPERVPEPPGADSTPAVRALMVLRIGLGIVWTLNLLFILDPSNAFFPTFASTASSFESTTLGGSAIPTFVSAHANVFAALTAGVTVYLAIAFLLGLTTRAACWVGLVFNGLLLLTQYGQIVIIPGGTDVGPHPLYLLTYSTLLVAGTAGPWSLDAWLGLRVTAHRPFVVGPTPTTATHLRARRPAIPSVFRRNPRRDRAPTR